MSLHTVRLYNKVNITPDYSIVTDLWPEDWLILLKGGNFHGQPVLPVATTAWQGTVNYYRLPDVLRIEAPYNDIRKVTYGSIEGENSSSTQDAFERPMFFWVKRIRLVKEKASTSTPGAVTVYNDIVELEISVDVWSSNYSKFELYDSFIERRHMDRWVRDSATPPNTTPLYYPNAAQGVEGSMRPSIKEDITKPIIIPGLSGVEVNLMWIVVSALDTDGKNQIFLGVMGRNAVNDQDITIYNYGGTKRIFGWKEVMDGSLYNALNLSADFIQSICVVPSLGSYWDGKITLKLTPDPRIVVDYSTNLGETTDFMWIIVGDGSGTDAELMNGSASATMNVVAPDPSYNAGDYDADEHEPMMYRAPARVRKVVSGYGGTIFDVPDIAAFESTYSWKVTYDLNGVNVFVFAGSDVVDANAIGAMGAEQAATLPIFNSAWKSYDAISRVGDDIAYKAHQVAAVGGGIANTTLAAAGGFLMGGGPAGAVLGAAGGITGTVTSVYANMEELEAKRTTIKNSPCNVKSGGSGLGAAIDWRLDFYYLTLQMDDQTMERLRSMYYWYGYHVDRTFKGAISLRTRKFFDFIKTSGARVRGDANAEDLEAIAAIFDKGVTIFHMNNAPYNYDRIMQAGIGNKRYNNDEVWL